jgi:pentatricopeptide repeat protein
LYIASPVPFSPVVKMRRPSLLAAAATWVAWCTLVGIRVSGFALTRRVGDFPVSLSTTAPTASKHRFTPNRLSMVVAGPEINIAVDPIQPNRNDTATLWSYVSNLQRVRREDSSSSIGNKAEEINVTDKNRLLKPAKSLVSFLAHHEIQEASESAIAGPSCLSEPLQRAVVQAIRIASPLNDYRLILNLVDGVWHYCRCNQNSQQQNQNQLPVLDPRIIGEAVSGLALTTASVGKIKSVWKVLADHDDSYRDNHGHGTSSLLTRPIGPREVNAMLTALDSRGKIRAAIDLYRQYASVHRTDAYSLSILVQALTNSIRDEDEASNPIAVGSEILVDTKENDRWQVLRSSACWQWRETVTILYDIMVAAVDDPLLNNHVLAAVLQLNERASVVHGRQHHHGAAMSVALLDWMKEYNISPDIITCTLLLSSLSTEAKVAVEFLRDMQQQQHQQSTQRDDESIPVLSTPWSLPRPNVYSYSAAISACARCREYATALELLDELRQQHDLEPNTVVYNAVLQALAQEARAKWKSANDASNILRTVLNLLGRMEEDRVNGMNTAPDTVTYNTVLSALGGIAPGLDESDWPSLEEAFPSFVGDPLTDWSLEERIAHTLLDKMVHEQIPRDAITYRHAMLTSGAGGLPSVMRFLDRATKEITKVANSIDVFNAGISALGSEGDVEGAIQVLSGALEAGIAPNSDTTLRLIQALGRGRKTSSMPVLLLAVSGNTDAIHYLGKMHSAHIDVHTLSPLDTTHFSAAIAACLLASDFKSARRVLGIMNDFGMQPSNSSLQEIARAYAVAAVERAATAKDSQPKSRKASKAPHDDISSRRARSAYGIVKDLDDTPVSLLSLVSKACASAGAFEEAQSLLRRIHQQVLERASADSSFEKKRSRERFGPGIAEQGLPGLHRALLRSCADKGNVTAALWFVEDIQYLSQQLSCEEGRSTESMLQPAIVDCDVDISELYGAGTSLGVSKGSIGMEAVEWRSLLIAASKSGHWKVCLSTLQFLRPYLEAVHASLAQNDEERILHQRDYDRIAPALTTAIRCLAVRSQYAWCVRSLYDWIEWSGRAPPKGAVLGAVRILAARGRGQEVNSLLAHCTTSSLSSGTVVYESSVYVGAITTLYNEGLYDDADDAFVAAISRGFLPLSLEKQTFGAEQRITLDLHGMNVAVAHSAVRMALQQEVLSISWNRTELWDNDMVIVTGQGRKSALRMRPVLRPEVQRMLVEEFYPPLSTASVPGNMGALRVPAEDIDAWLSHQREQKGARMLTLAAVLKNSGNRLRSALSRAAVPSGDETPRP